MSRKLIVGLASVVVLLAGSAAIAQVGILKQPAAQVAPADDTRLPANALRQPSGTTTTYDLNSPPKPIPADAIIETEITDDGRVLSVREVPQETPNNGPYQVAGVGNSAVLLEVNSGRTWILRTGMEEKVWLPISKIDSADEAKKWEQQEKERRAAAGNEAPPFSGAPSNPQSSTSRPKTFIAPNAVNESDGRANRTSSRRR